MTENKDPDGMTPEEREVFLHRAFDPTFRLPLIERPEESVETTMRRLDAGADLAMERCPVCEVQATVIAERDGIPITTEQGHAPGCPNRGDS